MVLGSIPDGAGPIVELFLLFEAWWSLQSTE